MQAEADQRMKLAEYQHLLFGLVARVAEDSDRQSNRESYS
jgi:hypothetical protein